ncbi:MAG TPA: TIGR03618 family F420-dependent PPOX class oxidoreductase [Solirubrobacteraceae bacterium]|nr:TIGR03618 family F420-dependent PPOX class oxidoreductase [Solirubrobacteraceae bacterium]
MADQQQLLQLIGRRREGILAGITKAGYPHLTNVFYLWDADTRTARISTTADRVKGRIFRRDSHAALHVAGEHFWSFAVGEGDADTSAVAAEPGDEAIRELLTVHSAYNAALDETEFSAQMIAARRLVVRLHVKRVYGVLLDKPPGT